MIHTVLFSQTVELAPGNMFQQVVRRNIVAVDPDIMYRKQRKHFDARKANIMRRLQSIIIWKYA